MDYFWFLLTKEFLVSYSFPNTLCNISSLRQWNRHGKCIVQNDKDLWISAIVLNVGLFREPLNTNKIFFFNFLIVVFLNLRHRAMGFVLSISQLR